MIHLKSSDPPVGRPILCPIHHTSCRVQLLVSKAAPLLLLKSTPTAMLAAVLAASAFSVFQFLVARRCLKRKVGPNSGLGREIASNSNSNSNRNRK